MITLQVSSIGAMSVYHGDMPVKVEGCGQNEDSNLELKTTGNNGMDLFCRQSVDQASDVNNSLR